MIKYNIQYHTAATATSKGTATAIMTGSNHYIQYYSNNQVLT